MEAEIDARVFQLYGLTPEEIRLIEGPRMKPAANKTNLKQFLRAVCLPALAERAAYFSHAEVQSWLRGRLPAFRPALLREYLSAAMRDGTVHDAGRGWYSRLAEPFKLNTKPVARLTRALEKAFPLLDFTCWSTEQIHGYGHHLLTRYAAIVHTERDAMESAGEWLRDAGWAVHVNPRGAAARQFAIRSERTVVIRPRTTTQPREGHFVSIEGLLVDLFIEAKALHLMDAGEYVRLLENLASQHRIRLAALLDYARERRPAGLKLIEHINADFLKKSALDGVK